MLGDSEIMQSTLVNERGVQFVLPDGQVMEGNKPQNAGEIEAWCTAVRQNLEIVHANQQNKRGEARKDRKPESKPSPEPAAEGGEPEDALAYAERMYGEAVRQAATLKEQLHEVTEAEYAAVKQVKAWGQILDALR